MRALFLLGEFLLDIPCWLLFLIRGVSLTHPVLFSFLSAESLLNIQCYFIFIWGVSLTHPILTLFSCGEFLLHIPRWLHFYCWEFLFIYLADFFKFIFYFLSGEFLLHIPCWLHFYVGNLSYTSHAVFIFVQGFCVTHPVLPPFLCGEFLLHIP